MIDHCILKCLIISCFVCSKSIWDFAYVISKNLLFNWVIVLSFHCWIWIWFIVKTIGIKFWFGMNNIALFNIVWRFSFESVLTLLTFTSLISSINRIRIIFQVLIIFLFKIGYKIILRLSIFSRSKRIPWYIWLSWNLWIIIHHIINISVDFEFLLLFSFCLTIALLSTVSLCEWSIVNINFFNVLITLEWVAAGVKIHICVHLSFIFDSISLGINILLLILILTWALLNIIYW